jgi:hypothetical protein
MAEGGLDHAPIISKPLEESSAIDHLREDWTAAAAFL